MCAHCGACGLLERPGQRRAEAARGRGCKGVTCASIYFIALCSRHMRRPVLALTSPHERTHAPMLRRPYERTQAHTRTHAHI
jgi:hypothetical protein